MKRTATALALACTLGAAPGADAAWSAWSVKDPMDGSVRKGMASSWTPPMRRMGFPYSDVRGLAGVSCDGRGAYFSFTA